MSKAEVAGNELAIQEFYTAQIGTREIAVNEFTVFVFCFWKGS
jgi:hypothetical protein